MENRQVTKEITIKDQVYQLSKVDARTATWLFCIISAKSDGGGILSGLGKCSRAEFDEFQLLALKHIMRMDNKDGTVFPIPVMGLNSVLIPELNRDPELVMRLTTDSLYFNLEPFLVEVGLNSQKSPT